MLNLLTAALCWQALPIDRCRTVLVTEFGGAVRLAGNQPDSRGTLFQYNLGAFRNLSPKAGVGLTLFGTWSESARTAGLAPRVRLWAGRRLSFDVAPGLIVFQGGSRNLGFNGHLAANLGPHLSITSTLQMTDWSSRHFERKEWFVGARLNGKAGTIAGLATPVAAFLAYVAFFAPRE